MNICRRNAIFWEAYPLKILANGANKHRAQIFSESVKTGDTGNCSRRNHESLPELEPEARATPFLDFL